MQLLLTGREQLSANKQSGLNILTDDIKNPIWKINVPLKKKHFKSRTLRAMGCHLKVCFLISPFIYLWNKNEKNYYLLFYHAYHLVAVPFMLKIL